MICRYDFATPAYDEAVAIRQRVLRLPLGLDIADDPLHEEFDQTHFGAFEAGRLLGTASLVATGAGALKMRQVAVDADQQGRGIGRALVAACEAYARRLGAERLYCHARDVAVPFYKSCGWRPEGEPFTEVGIEHRILSAPAAHLRPPSQGESGGR